MCKLQRVKLKGRHKPKLTQIFLTHKCKTDVHTQVYHTFHFPEEIPGSINQRQEQTGNETGRITL